MKTDSSVSAVETRTVTGRMVCRLAAGLGLAMILTLATPAAASWPNSIGGLADDQIHAMVTDANGNVYVVGQFEGAAVFGSEILESEGQSDLFVAKFDSSGKSLWASRGGGAAIDRGLAITLDPSGTPYVTGVFSRTATFEGGLTVGLPKELPSATGDDDDTDDMGDIVVGKLDPENGTWEWLAQIEDDGFADQGLAIAFLRGGGSTPIDSVVVAARTACPTFYNEDGDDQGQMGLSCNTNDTRPNIVLASIDTLGTWNWAFSDAGSSGSSEWVTGLSVDANGYLYVAGKFTADTSIGGTSVTLADVPGSTANAVLEFEHSYDYLCCLDSTRLQFSQDGGGWTDVTQAQFLQGGYDNAGGNGWGGYGIRSAFKTRVDLSAFTSSSVRFRWVYSDASEASIDSGENGWFIDDVKITFGEEVLLEEGFDSGNGPFSLAGQFRRLTDCSSESGCRGMDPPLMQAYDGVVTSTETLTMSSAVTIPGDPNYFVARITDADIGSPEWNWVRTVDPALSLEQMVVGPDGGGGSELKIVGTALASSVSPVVTSAGAYVAALPLSGSTWGATTSLGAGRGQGLAIAPDGSIFVTGTYSGAAPGGTPTSFPIVNGVAGEEPPVAGDDDVFVAKFDNGFSPAWISTGGDPGASPQGADRGRTVAVYDDGVVTQVYVGGEFSETATFFRSDTDTQTLTSYGNANIFMHNLDGQNGAWFFLGLQSFIVGTFIEPPPLALLTDQILARPAIEFDAPGSETDYFFWSPPDGNPDGIGRLYALQPVEARILWRREPPGGVDPTDPPPQNLEQLVLTRWPTQVCPTLDNPATPADESDEDGDGFVDPCRQVHIALAPVDLTTPGSGIFYATSVKVQPGTASDGVVNASRVFNASTPGFSVLLFADNPSDANINAHPPVIEIVQTYDGSSAPAFVSGAACTIGREIDGFDFNHDDLVGRNGFVAEPRAAYDPDIYEASSRSGQIVPVNRVNPLTTQGDDDMVIVWYRRNFKPAPLDPTADPATDPVFDPNRIVGGIPWGEKPVHYDCQWPADPSLIIIASETGSEVLGQQVLDPQEFPLMQIYNQPDPAIPGFNPNDEHAFFAPSNLGTGFDALFAVRSDFFLEGSSTDPSEAYSMLKYFDQDNQKWLFKVYQVLDSGAGFSGFQFPGTAGTKVSAPYPVSLLGSCPETRGEGTAYFQDYSGAVWAKAKGSMSVRYWYPLQPTFFWSRDTNGPEGVPNGVAESTGECVPWLDQLPDTDPLQPVEVVYNIVWPDNVPQLIVGDTLLRQKNGLPNIFDQAAVQIAFDESDPDVVDPNTSLAQIINPLNSRTVSLLDVSATPDDNGELPKVPLTSKVATQLDPESGTSTLVSNADGTIRLPFTVRSRIVYDPLNLTLSWRGTLDEEFGVVPLFLLNVMSAGDRDLLLSLAPGDEDYVHAIRRLYILSRNPQMLDLDGDCEVDDAYLIGLQDSCDGNTCADDLGFEVAPQKGCAEPLFDGSELAAGDLRADDLVRRNLTVGGVSEVVYAKRGDTVAESLEVVGFKPALTAGLSSGNGFMTLAFNNDASLAPLPVSLNVIRVDCFELPDGTSSTYQGVIHVIQSDNVFDELLTLRHSGDFGGDPADITFEWFSHPDVDGTPPQPLPDIENGQLNGWLQFPVNPDGANEITIQGANIQTLSDNWFLVRYKGLNACNNDQEFSVYAGQPGSSPIDIRAQLAPGWVKRVIDGLNPFETRVKDFHAAPTNTFASMITQLGGRYEGDIAFNPSADNLNRIGLIEAYETVLRRAMNLSVNGTPPVNYAPANNALLLVASRIADFYSLLGNEAWADAQDPMIGFGTSSGAFGTLAPTIFAFQNQLDSLLEEELVLLRGRDDSQAPVKVGPVYNRLYWNFTTGEGEVAYSQVYNMTDQNLDGIINFVDGRTLFPQGHGDAWGQYLTGIKTYYKMLKHPFFTWIPRPEPVSVAQVPIQVDFLDERKFAKLAAAKARAGAEIVDLTYRIEYVEDPAGQWQGYTDTDPDRAWGLSGWARRAGQGAYFDWVVGNSLLPVEDTDPEHRGIQKIDRKRVVELGEIIGHFDEIQAQVDEADRGLNPLGLAKGVVPFDIDPGYLRPGFVNLTHFEQIYDRAKVALDNTVAVFNHANELNQLLRRSQDTIDDLTINVTEQERDYNNRLIEIYGYPYSDDIGPGGAYEEGHNGPDVYHWMYVDQSDLTGTPEAPAQIFTAEFDPLLAIGHFNFSGAPKPECIFDPTAFGCSLSDVPDIKLQVDYHLSTSSTSVGLIKPPEWRGQRRATGELQDRLSDYFVALNSYDQILKEYDNLVTSIKAKAKTIEVEHGVRQNKIRVQQTANNTIQGFDIALRTMTASQIALRRTAIAFKEQTKAVGEAIPKSTIAGLAAGGDLLSAARGSIQIAGQVTGFVLDTVADGIEIAKLPIESLKERVGIQVGLTLDVLDADLATRQALGELQAMMREEPLLQLEAYSRREVIEQQRGAVLQALAKGQRLLAELEQFRRNTAADVQEERYQDMTFRVFRNDALQKYRAQFDLAARYAFLAATAYDYETNLMGGNPQSGQDFLTDIVRQRSLGQLVGGEPIAGSPGLADPMARLAQNFAVLKGQLGFNNPQTETNRFSLRRELFRLDDSSPESDAEWRRLLEEHRVDNLFSNELFRRYARPFAPEELGDQPGIIIPFSTTVTFGMNFFGWPLGPGDSAYDPSNFATKVRNVGVWFKDYDELPLSSTPRVYLIPVGEDVLRSPDATDFATREWSVVDQKLPVPFPIGADNLDDPDWIPVNDGLSEDLFEIRRFSSFKAFSFTEGDPIDGDQMTSDTRLVGRSVWNTRWLLIIPGGTMLFDPEDGLDTFIHGTLQPGGNEDRDGDGVKDISFFFQTYAYSGN